MINHKIAIISYLNSKPFIYGLTKNNLIQYLDIKLDYPAICADMLLRNEVDLALAPITVIKQLKNYKIISDYCIGSDGAVDTVCLYSEVPIQKVESIFLDYQSRTSVELLKLLLNEYWKINPLLKKGKSNYENNINGNNAGLVIGDRAFHLNKKYNYIYDLSLIWKEMTGLPFVFACWISVCNLSKQFLCDFNNSLKYGVENIDRIFIDKDFQIFDTNSLDYLNNKISYNLDSKKQKSIDLFLKKIN